MDAVVLLPGQGERIEAGAITATMKATADTTGGAFSLSEGTLPAGASGPPPHAHRRTTDTLWQGVTLLASPAHLEWNGWLRAP
jgi:hypothetical protein